MYLRANRARLKAAHTYVTDELKTLGVPFLNRSAGFFVWIDFRKVGSGRGGGSSWAEGGTTAARGHLDAVRSALAAALSG